MRIEQKEYPFEGHDLSPREKIILTNLVGNYYDTKRFKIKVEDYYYYIRYFDSYYNKFEKFDELKNYILSCYYIETSKDRLYLKFLKTSKLNPSFDRNRPIRWASEKGKTEIVKYLLKDNRVDPSDNGNWAIWWAFIKGNKEIVKLLYNDTRVRDKLSYSQVKYTILNYLKKNENRRK